MSITGIMCIAIKQVINDNVIGEIFTVYKEEPIPFHNLLDMVLKIDCLISDIEKLKAQGMKPVPRWTSDKFQTSWKSLYFFLIDVKYSQHSTWQGTMRYSGKAGEICFKSVLDLLKKMLDIMYMKPIMADMEKRKHG
ncbi:hypothetical protein NE683_19945 [Bariatricus massiliensis]|uniref:Uncharacterized protein n=1 Tax=Bariatricus massiliensis TaxID=1745713 RepID=A0ABS8DM51_9FIRM|nr:hypothetical protein [Bariatricus massiliensis]MCB7306365.1 hypothetical protein [Bariatricus massiliensis]MCB7376873.1 hypothetical protein [Bariatricus massiliensis]MCB7389536.1 hypothetical protein [Bariatricus massiliensis]MCB7413693.1 hypothetical protein [Bariatricus massiliensis]MCQ5255494.1 hypothetical protein [Bariatricus massiliensis]